MNINLKSLKYSELKSLLININYEMDSRIPISIHCPHCKEIFPLVKNKLYSEELYIHLKKKHRYPDEDASLSSGNDRNRFIYE